MAVSSAILMGTTAVVGGVQQASSAKIQGKYAQQQAEANARLDEIRAQDALKRGDKEAAQVRNKAKQLEGSQRASMAAQGIDLGSGTASDILSETQDMGRLDALTVKNNAYREAWGYSVEAQNKRYEGKFARMSAKNEARNTLLTSGMQAASYGASAYGSYKQGPDAKGVYGGSSS